eukprot:15171423-Alexandrium_andersonii.AAC.1
MAPQWTSTAPIPRTPPTSAYDAQARNQLRGDVGGRGSPARSGSSVSQDPREHGLCVLVLE